jgi:TolA-binding protein
MNEKLLDILNPQGRCIAEETLLRYSKNMLSLEELRSVEEHLTECELCSDALDGLMTGVNEKQFRSRVTSIRQTLRRKLQLNEKRETFPFTRALAIAATVLLLVVSAWFVQYLINNETEKIFSDQFKPYPVPKADSLFTRPITPAITDANLAGEEPERQVSSPESLLNTEENPAGKLKTSAEAKKEISAPDSIHREEPVFLTDVPPRIIESDNSSAARGEETVIQPAADESEDLVRDGMKITQKSASAPASADATKRASGKEEESMLEQQVVVSLVNLAMKYYGDQKYADAIARFEEVIDVEPGNSQANFYAGVSSLALNDPDRALKFFSKTDDEKDPFYEATLWYQSLAYIKKDDKKAARKLLEKVISLGGENQRKAEETLRDL